MTIRFRMNGEARRLTRMLSDYDELLEDSFDEVMQVMVGNSRMGGSGNALIAQNFSKKVGSQRTFTKLKPKTVEQKKKNGEPFMLVSSKKLRRSVVKNTKSKKTGNRFKSKAGVPDYGEFINEGKGNQPERRYFTIRRNQKALFHKVFENILLVMIRKRGIFAKRR